MKLTRNAATTFDSENSEHRRNRGRFHFYRVEGNAESELDQLALVDSVFYSIATTSDFSESWHERACLCADYSEGYACNYTVELDEVEDFKALWKLVKAQVAAYAKTFDHIPTDDQHALNILGYAIAGKIVRNSKGQYALHDRIYNLSVKSKAEYEERQKARAEKAAKVDAPAAAEQPEPAPQPGNMPKAKNDEIKSFKLSSPCKDCPFRNDLPAHFKGWLGKARAEGIALSTFKMGQSFPCHKTTDLGARDGEDGTYTYDEKTSQCAGAAIMQIKTGNPSAYMQIAERLGWTKEVEAMKRLDMNAPVFETPDQFIEFHTNGKG
ncbi:DUF5417 domain-containing protein [Acinetobacter lwoffii]|uniref:DUF5417 domain-containing protein n=1 Tax=Acinetobacter lwoffii TaxID=28090 RepID=UPI0030095DFB